jgi:PAS domain S-box-containing protein
MTNTPNGSTSLFDQGLDRFPDLLFLVDPEGVILDYRGGSATSLYAPPDAFLGRSMLSVLPQPASNRLRDAVARVSKTQHPVAVDYTLPLPEGERAFEARLIPLLPQAILAVCRDVTSTSTSIEQGEGQRPNEKLNPAPRPAAEGARDLDQGLRRLAESIDHVLWLRNTSAGRVLYVSPAFASVFGRPAHELYANPEIWMQSIHPDDRASTAACYDAWFSGRPGAGSVAFRVVRPDGTTRSLIDRVTVFSDRPNSDGHLGGVVSDVTAQQGLLGEFNDTLSILIGNVQIAQRLALDFPAMHESLERIVSASRTVESLVRRMHALVPAVPAPSLSASGPVAAKLAPPGSIPSLSSISAWARNDWLTMLKARPNTLIVGTASGTEELLQLLLPQCVGPVVEWNGAPADPRPATLLVRDLANLPAIEQRCLLQWIEGGERSQIISTSTRPLLPLVAQGRFSERLLYCLNVLRLEV